MGVVEADLRETIKTKLKIVIVRIRTKILVEMLRVRILTCKVVVADLKAKRLDTHVLTRFR